MALSMAGWAVLVLSTVLGLIGRCESSLCSRNAPGSTWRQDREPRTTLPKASSSAAAAELEVLRLSSKCTGTQISVGECL